MPLVCDLKEKAALIETLVGGKGLSLALLQSLQDNRVGFASALGRQRFMLVFRAVPGTCWLLRDHRGVRQTDPNIPPFGVGYHLPERGCHGPKGSRAQNSVRDVCMKFN